MGQGFACKAGKQFRSLGQEDPLEEGMATHSSILAGESHGQESGEPQSRGPRSQPQLKRVSTGTLPNDCPVSFKPDSGNATR